VGIWSYGRRAPRQARGYLVLSRGYLVPHEPSMCGYLSTQSANRRPAWVSGPHAYLDLGGTQVR
jgi:hypothetical protein